MMNKGFGASAESDTKICQPFKLQNSSGESATAPFEIGHEPAYSGTGQSKCIITAAVDVNPPLACRLHQTV
ncbi:MAG: hypothetical protein M3247_09320 [Thermoproteota archaeon]|jgi:hypothetical protein|nr:hypothetical protein [Thermoproteota archaeon]